MLSGATEEATVYSVVLKIFLNTMQLNQLSMSLDFKWGSPLDKILRTQDQVLSKAQMIPDVGCVVSISPVYVKALSLSTILTIMLPVLVYYSYKSARADRSSDERFLRSDSVVGGLVFIIFLMYPTLVLSTLDLFVCVDGGATKQDTFLRADMRQHCFSTEHKGMVRVVGTWMWVLIFAIPTCVFFFLGREKNHLNDVPVLRRFGYLYKGYRVNSFMWEGVVLSRKVAVTVLSVIFRGFFITQAVFLLIIIYCSGMLIGKYRPFEEAPECRDRKAEAQLGVIASNFIKHAATHRDELSNKKSCSEKVTKYLDHVDLNTLEAGSLSVSLFIFSFGIILSLDSTTELQAQALTYLILLLNFGYVLYMMVGACVELVSCKLCL